MYAAVPPAAALDYFPNQDGAMPAALLAATTRRRQ
jgi:hypothetical protein